MPDLITTLTQRLQTFPANARHTILVDLGGTAYRMELWYNGRGQYWALSLATADGTPLVSGRKLVNNWPPVFRLPQARPHYGELSVEGDADVDVPMAQDALGSNLDLHWFTLQRMAQ